MNITSLDLFPGVVVDANDPKTLGRVKIVAAGFQDNSTMDVQDMYWSMPFSCNGYQRMSKPTEGMKVWVLNNKDNRYESWFIPMWDLNQNTTVAINGGDDYDVLVSRSGEGLGAQMFYNQHDGFVTGMKNDATFTISPSCNIEAKSNGVEMSCTDGNVKLGTQEKCTHPAVQGDVLVELLQNLASKINYTASIAAGSWTTAHLSAPLNECVQAINNTVSKINSKKVFISE